MDFIDACLKLISIDSSPSAGNLEAARFLLQLAEKEGLATFLHEEMFNGLPQANLIVSARANWRNQPSLLLLTHLDTVEPHPFSLWTKTGGNPFEPTVYNNKIFGLGAADTKLDFLCKLKALKENASLAQNVVLVGTYGEENGMVGITRLMRRRLISPTHALVGEPTGLRLVTSGKGIAVFELKVPFSDDELRVREKHNEDEISSSQSRIFSGRASHSSSGDQSENAIRKLIEFLSQVPQGTAILEMEGGINFNTIPDHSFLEVDFLQRFNHPMVEKLSLLKIAMEDMETQFKNFADARFDPPEPVLNIGQVRTEEESIHFEGCLRLPPTVDESVYLNWLETFRKRAEGVGAVFQIRDFKRPFLTDDSSEFTKLCQSELKKQSLPIDLSRQSVTNEANVLTRLGVECLVFGPGELQNNAHTAHENVDIENLNRAVRFYENVIQQASQLVVPRP